MSSQAVAIAIVAEKTGLSPSPLSPPEKNFAYGIDPTIAWYFSVPWNDGLTGTMTRSSRVVCVAKLDGKILYDGDANDEG